MISLGIDTSNYATSLAVVNSTNREVVCAVKKMLPVKKGMLGVRQSDAVFHHTVALPMLIEELNAQTNLQLIEVVGVSTKPRPQKNSYMPCFLSGISFAKAFAFGKKVKIVETTHQQGHVMAARLGINNKMLLDGKALTFHLSGGTTELLLTDGYTICKVLGASKDLYAGQAVDRLGVKLGFGFPAGAHISALASECSDEITPKISISGCDCHFSGLENQCNKLLQENFPPEYVSKYCLLAIAKTVLAMAQFARVQYPELPIICAGGVMSSIIIKRYLENKLNNVYFAPEKYSSDNAIGTALIAAYTNEGK